jgi:tetratricopeptide (TPR) repeat protein
MNIFQIEERLKEEPTSPLSVRLAGLYVARTRVDEAIELCAAAIERNPKYATAYTILGRCYAANKQYEAAIYCLDKSLSLLPDAEIAKRLSDNWRKSVTTGDSQNVLESLKAKLEKLSGEPAHPETLTQTDNIENQNIFPETPELATTDVGQNLSETFTETLEKPESEFAKPDDDVELSQEQAETTTNKENFQTIPDLEQPSATDKETQNTIPEIPEIISNGKDNVTDKPVDTPSLEPHIPITETIDAVTSSDDQIFIRSLIEESLSTSFKPLVNDDNQNSIPASGLTESGISEQEPPAKPSQEIKTNFFTGDISPAIVSTTLAEIYTKQGEYGEAIKIYMALISRRPKEREYFEQKIKELESKMNLKQ